MPIKVAPGPVTITTREANTEENTIKKGLSTFNY